MKINDILVMRDQMFLMKKVQKPLYCYHIQSIYVLNIQESTQ